MNWKRTGIGLAFLFFLTCGCAVRPAAAQFVGYVGLQTEQRRLMNNVPCSPTATATVRNIGQTQHQITYVFSGALTEAKVLLEGSYDGLFFFPFSQVSTGVDGRNVFQATGYFPVVRVVVSCTPTIGAPTVVLDYTGSQVTPGDPAASVDQTIYRKSIISGGLQSAAFNSAATLGATFTPYGNTLGKLCIEFHTSSVAASALTVEYFNTTFQLAPFTVSTFAPANVTTPQCFDVANQPAEAFNITYTPGAGAADLYDLIYYFYKPGQGPVAVTVGGIVSTAGPVWGPDAIGAPSTQPPVQIGGRDVAGNARAWIFSNTATGGIPAFGVRQTVPEPSASFQITPFDQFGNAGPFAIGVNFIAGVGGNSFRAAPACEQRVVVSQAAVGPLEIITPAAGSTVRVCSVALNTGAAVATANTWQLVTGTGANCAVGPVNVTGVHFVVGNILTPGPQLVFPGGGLFTTQSASLCLTLGAATSVTGTITYSKF